MTLFINIQTTLKDTSVVIQWETDIAATGQIEYGSDTNYGGLTEVEGLSYWHPIEIKDLTPGTTYHYRIRGKDYKGEETTSSDYTFVTRTNTELESVIRAVRINGDLPKTYYVKNDGNNSNNGLSLETAWATPYYAASRAEVGDMILVADGTYSGYVDFGWYVGVSGIPEAPITMKAYSGKPIIAGEIDILSNYITIDGFKTYGAGGHGIDVRNAKGIKILNFEVYNSGIDGIYFRDVTYSIIENTVVHNTGWNGIGIKPTSYFPFPGHHIWIRNSRAYDILNHNAFDVQGDYMTFENCDANNSLLAPMGLLGDHVVVNNFVGQQGNNGIAVRSSLANSIILNNTLIGGPILRQAGVVSNTIFYNNNITYSKYGILINSGIGNLVEENNVITNEIDGYTYGFEGTGNVTIRNNKVSPYKARSIEGATITVEYTDGRVFSVNGAGQYTIYTWTGGTRTINVVGLTPIGNISGNVKNINNINLPNITVSDGIRYSNTDSNGNYIISNIPIGTYDITASGVGYISNTIQEVQVTDGITTTNVNFSLQIIQCPIPICNITIQSN